MAPSRARFRAENRCLRDHDLRRYGFLTSRKAQRMSFQMGSKRREDLYAILWAIETPRPLEGRVVVNRQRPETRHAALLRSADVARILPYSIRQIEKMAAEG